MLRDLEKIIDECDANGGDGERLEVELRQAAQNLWRAQFLYRDDFGSKGSYDLLLEHRAYFENLFGALGYRIVGGRPDDRLLGLLATDLPARQTMKLDESLVLLVLRLYYEEAFKRYEINDNGEVEVDGETLLQVYEDRTRRIRPLVTRLHEILTGFRQRGLVRVEDQGDSRSFKLYLRPALPMVVGEETLASLDEFIAKGTAAQAGGQQDHSNAAAAS
ncbi:DUF4194 domain-containing protein [Reyranella sp. CPCC 100927]|uniref:DUF4194 domain-containing protein n=1 Tax=Reyranella sp. CPCC 100927 TaxID=2599616 RepID=UPI0011B6BB61|nr:DUF4194 domain-containing protein [Reyranella sp. CPCC 100927]TWS99842.1 DUF4194 domain-containing protein [Reyranella sp. CPCC 100927]